MLLRRYGSVFVLQRETHACSWRPLFALVSDTTFFRIIAQSNSIQHTTISFALERFVPACPVIGFDRSYFVIVVHDTSVEIGYVLHVNWVSVRSLLCRQRYILTNQKMRMCQDRQCIQTDRQRRTVGADDPPRSPTTHPADHTDHNQSTPTTTNLLLPSHLVHLEKSNGPGCTCQISRGSSLPDRCPSFHRSNQMTTVFNRTSLQTAERQKPKRPQILWSKDRHSYHQAFPEVVQNFGAHKKPSSISFASRPCHPWHGDLFQIYLKFSTEDTLYLIGHLTGRDGVITRQDFLLFLTSTFVILLINFSTPGRRNRSACLCTGHSLAQTDVKTRRHLAAPSSPQGRTIRAQSSSCFPSATLSTKL